MDWRDVARERRIPVWPWSAVAVLWGHQWRDGRVEAVGSGVIDVRVEYHGDVSPLPDIFDAEDVVPNLADPDMRAAYDRRLALELGAPVEAVAEGVRFYRYAFGWQIDAGQPHVDGYMASWWEMLDSIKTSDPLLARALAWPVGVGQ